MLRTPDAITTRLAIALTAALGLLALMEQSHELQRLLEPVNLVLARATEFLLRHMETPVSRQGAVLMHPDGFSYRITYVCSGFRPAALIAVTLLMVPATWVSRLRGLFIALVGIEVLNLFRLVHLYWAGVEDPGAFFVAHRVTWNIVAILAVIGFLALWLCLSKHQSREDPVRAKTSHALQ